MFKKLVWWTWCLPQMLIALCLFIYCVCKKNIIKTEEVNGRKYIYVNWHSGSISLGRWIFLCNSHWHDENVKLHEFGHTKQSLILGPLYLLVIGLPSIIWCACFNKYRSKHQKNYYSFYTESWANKLMKIDIQ